jgi:hypothetical protein
MGLNLTLQDLLEALNNQGTVENGEEPDSKNFSNSKQSLGFYKDKVALGTGEAEHEDTVHRTRKSVGERLL